jgi:hypothetical protein
MKTKISTETDKIISYTRWELSESLRHKESTNIPENKNEVRKESNMVR